MLRIRDQQMNAFRADLFKKRYDIREVACRVIERLREIEILAPSESPPGESADGEGGPSAAEEKLRDEVQAEVDQALLYGITSMDGLTQYASYRFMVSPEWHENPKVREALERPGLTEKECLWEVHRLLN